MNIDRTIDDTFSSTANSNDVDRTKMADKATQLKDSLKEDEKSKKKPKKRKAETTEATTSGSAGAFSGPAIWAKDKKNWRGRSKTTYPRGKFVEIKGKCKTFPYCDEGDIKSLRLFDNETLTEAIREVSSDMGIVEEDVKRILMREFLKKRKK